MVKWEESDKYRRINFLPGGKYRATSQHIFLSSTTFLVIFLFFLLVVYGGEPRQKHPKPMEKTETRTGWVGFECVLAGLDAGLGIHKFF